MAKSPEAAQLEGQLLAGKFLVLHESMYDKAVTRLREEGVSEKAIENVYKSRYLPESQGYIVDKTKFFPDGMPHL